MTRHAIAYIDGHNFYHGVVKDCPELKWLDFQSLCERLLRGYHLDHVNYYTAKVIDFPTDPSQSQRQDTYLRALRTRPKIEVVLGQFQAKKRKRVHLSTGGTALADLYEEKGSDVNLGTDLSWDAAQESMAAALVISNDFDLQRPIDRAVAAGIDVIVVNPHHRSHRRPSVKGTDVRKLHRKDLTACQLPHIVLDLDGTELHRPASWA
jgi:hypothetical protein